MDRFIKRLRIAADGVMLVTLWLLMGYPIIDDALHEWVGVVMFIVFIVHNILNFRWYQKLFSGRYTLMRATRTILNLLLFCAACGAIISSLCISGYVFSFIDLGATRFGRVLHLSSTAWMFVLSSLHFGFHFPTFIKRFEKTKLYENRSRICKIVASISAAEFTIGGAAAFITRRLWEELFVLTEFKRFDFNKPLAMCIVENICITIAIGMLGLAISKAVGAISNRRGR